MDWPPMATTGLAEVDATISAGVFVTRPRGGQGETEVLIMQRGWVMGWQFAKGRLNKKDQGNLVKCAFRELRGDWSGTTLLASAYGERHDGWTTEIPGAGSAQRSPLVPLSFIRWGGLRIQCDDP